jgi:hypothetical protein
MSTISMNLVAYEGRPFCHVRVSMGMENQTSLLTAFEPQKRDDTTKTNILLEDIGYAHASVQEFLTTLI